MRSRRRATARRSSASSVGTGPKPTRTVDAIRPEGHDRPIARTTLPLFPTDDGWPYPDALESGPIVDDEPDLDALEIRADRHAFDALSPDEYDVLTHRFGFVGPPQSMKELARERGCTHAEATEVLGRAIEKMRARLAPG